MFTPALIVLSKLIVFSFLKILQNKMVNVVVVVELGENGFAEGL